MYIPSQIHGPYMGQHAERVAAVWRSVMSYVHVQMYIPSQTCDPYTGQHAERVEAPWGGVMTYIHVYTVTNR